MFGSSSPRDTEGQRSAGRRKGGGDDLGLGWWGWESFFPKIEALGGLFAGNTDGPIRIKDVNISCLLLVVLLYSYLHRTATPVHSWGGGGGSGVM